MTLCFFKFLGGLPCPGCGFLHALWALAEADGVRAFLNYPVWPVVGVAFVFRRRRAAVALGFVAVMGQWLIRFGVQHY